MEGWITKKLEDVVDLKRGFDLPTHSRRPGPYPVLSSGVTAGWHDEGPIKGPGLVIGRATNLGQPSWSQGDFWPLNTTLYAANFFGNEPRWVFHLFESMDLTGFDSGSVQPMLNRNYIAQLPILVPPIREQRAIAEVLGALDDKIAGNTKLAETADTLASTLIQRHTVPGQSEPLNAIAMLTMGSSPTGETLNEDGDGSVFYQGVRDYGFRYPENRVWTTSPVRMAKPDDTLISVRAPVGRVNLASEETCIGRGLASARSVVGAPYTLFHVLQASATIWEPYEAEGTVFGSINKKQLESIQIPKVDGAEGLEDRLAALERGIRSSIEENRTLAATRDTLLPQLMLGKLRVKDIENTMGEMV